MEARELRIGNYINNGFNDVIRISEYSMISKHLTAGYVTYTLKPIPLTEEWLLKFGFNSTFHGDCSKFELYEFSDLPTIESNSDGIYIYGHNRFIKFETVHQLQNFWFALTGEELTLKD